MGESKQNHIIRPQSMQRCRRAQSCLSLADYAEGRRVYWSRRKDGAARAVPNAFELCPVVTDEDKVKERK